MVNKLELLNSSLNIKMFIYADMENHMAKME